MLVTTASIKGVMARLRSRGIFISDEDLRRWKVECFDNINEDVVAKGLLGDCHPIQVRFRSKFCVDARLQELLVELRKIMCKVSFECREHAANKGWQAFACFGCPKANDPDNELRLSDLRDGLDGLAETYEEKIYGDQAKSATD